MRLIKGFIMSLGMFSTIPVPKNSWDDRYMPAVIPCLPLVGLLIGLIWYGISYALSGLTMPPLIQGVIVLLIPFALNGFIHADGYMDTADAVFSRRDLEDKKRILKDPHAGAFAVIAIAVLLLFQFCAVTEILNAQKPLRVFIFIPAISRCVAGIAMLNLKSVFESGFNASFRKNTKTRHTLFICAVMFLCFLSAYLFSHDLVLPLLIGASCGALTAAYLYKQFRGMSGDLCGFVITAGEFAALLCTALV